MKSCLIARIGRMKSYFQNLKTFDLKYGLVSRFENCKGKYFKRGAGICAMTTISACLTDIEQKKDDETTEEIQVSKVIRNLEQIVKQRSYFYYNAYKRYFFKEYKPDMRIDWSGVTFHPDEPKYKQTYKGADGYRVTSRTVFENQSKTDQEHKLKAERQTYSLSESSLTEGYTIGHNIGLSFPVPGDIGLSAEFSLQRVTGNIDEEKCAWHVEDIIKVPRKSTIVVSMLLNEKETEYSFSTRIGVKGAVIVSYYDQQGEIDTTYTIPMRAIIREEFPERMREEEDKVTYIRITGRCKFKQKLVKTVITNEE